MGDQVAYRLADSLAVMRTSVARLRRQERLGPLEQRAAEMDLAMLRLDLRVRARSEGIDIAAGAPTPTPGGGP